MHRDERVVDVALVRGNERRFEVGERVRAEPGAPADEVGDPFVPVRRRADHVGERP